ncbi:MAG: glycosyltransferase family 39 protein [Magnetococcales bacterium]|nr:glycosyltransferase family 39 protein [Magnetococcales bacterium]
MEQKTTPIPAFSPNPTISKKQIAWIGTVVLVAIHLFFLMWAGPKYQNSDDSIYSRIAHEIVDGRYKYDPMGNPGFQNRYGVTVPTALGYKLFGINRYSLVLWSWLCSILTLTLLFNFVLKRYGLPAGFISGLIFATNTKQIGTALMLSVDVILSFFMFLSAVILYEARQPEARGRERFFAIAFVATLMMATLSKLLVISIFPAFAILMAVDLKNQKHKTLWINIVAIGLLFGGAYLIWMHIYTGSYMSRFAGTLNVFQSLDSMQIKNYNEMMNNLPARLTYKPILVILSIPGLLIPFALALAALFQTGTKDLDHKQPVAGQGVSNLKNTGYWWLLIFSAMFYIWFIPGSFNPFIPIILIPRYFLPLIPFLALLAGVALASIYSSNLWAAKSRQYFWWLGFIYLVLFPLLNTLGYFKLGVVIVTAPVLFALVWDRATFISRPISSLRTPLITVLSILVFSLLPAHFIINNVIGEKPWQKVERESIQRYFVEDKEPKVVYSNKRGLISINFFRGYEKSKDVQLVNWQAVKDKKYAAGTKHYIYINKNVVEGLKITYSRKPPTFVYNPPANWQLVVEEQGVAIYKSDDIPEFVF